jgi:gliding motility-associated-like protein
MQKICLAIFLVFVFFSSGNAQVKWTVKKPFEQKNFIENKGQFFIEDKLNSKEILYAASIDGVTYYFTKTGYVMQHLASQKNTEKEIEELKEKAGIKENAEGEEEKEFKYKTISQLHQMQWQGTNANVQIVAEDIVSNYYTYSDLNDKQGKKTIKAQAYKKLTYKNLYPFIDVVYEFPADTTGIKYSIYLHPGANVNNIKINYPDNNGINLNQQGNILIKSEFGLLTDHKPITYQQNNKAAIKSNFILHDNTVSFFIDKTLTNETIVIDPWTANPNFPFLNRAYDVDYDAQGNVYVYGGYKNPFYLNKYSPTGGLIWTHAFNLFSNNYYGDFAIDINSGSIYIVQGFNPGSGAQVLKLNSAGIVTTTFPGNRNFGEMWRITFDKCSNRAVIAGGGTSSPTYQTCMLDTNLIYLNMVQYVASNNFGHDASCLALDNFGNCYQITNHKSFRFDGLFDNQLVKLPMPSLTPTTYYVPTNHHFVEAESNLFYSAYSSTYANGYNGITASNTNVFTYDSYILKKWQGSNGTQLASKTINTPAHSDSLISWGGLTSDDCDNVFLGSINKVNQYDPNLNLTNSFAMTDTIYDVKLGRGNNLYVCGAGFVSAIQVLLSTCSPSNIQATQTVQNAGCGNALGSATVVASGAGSQPPYTITWNTTPVQTGSVAINLPSGAYLVTITDASCHQQIKIDTVLVGFNGFQTQINTSSATCNGLSTCAATITATSGAFPYTYQWQTGQNTPAVSGLAAGTYTVKVTNATGTCANTFSITLTQPAPITATISKPDCKDVNSAYLKVTASGGTGPYTYSWSTNPIQTTDSIYDLSQNSYSVTVTDANLCSKSFSETISLNFQTFETVNVFKPNGDTKNEVFFPFAYGNNSIDVLATLIDNYELYIYDRWGKKVFYTTQPTTTWDGKEANGSTCPNGVYFWMLSINSKCQTAGTQTFKGFVHLDR